MTTEEPTENPAEPDVPEEQTEPTPEPEVPNMSDLKGVRYVGTANRKTLSVKDLENVGVKGVKQDLVWDDSNNKFILAHDINAAARDYFAAQSDFIIE